VNESGYQFELRQARLYRKEHSHGTGAAVLNNATLQSYEERGGLATITIYVCEDISGVDRLDASGKSMVSPDRGNYFDYEVVLAGRAASSLVIQSNKRWTGGGICKF
jgi:hypothetical protein